MLLYLGIIAYKQHVCSNDRPKFSVWKLLTGICELFLIYQLAPEEEELLPYNWFCNSNAC